jgi:hypothetical protein
MKELNENPIDQYFREILESPDLKFNKQDWKGLKKMLPNRYKQKRFAWWFSASVAAAILLLFCTLWLWKNPDENNEVAGTSKNQKATSKQSKDQLDKGKDEFSENELPVKNGQQSIKPTFGERPADNLTDSPRSGIYSEREQYVLVPDIDDILVLKPAESIEIVQNEGLPTVKDQQITSVLEIPADKTSRDEENKVVKDPDQKGKLALALSLSPDLNSVSSFSNSSFGTSIGVGASYSISPRFRVSTAVSYSKKRYSAKPYEYKSAWAYTVGKNAESIEAECNVLDIPIDLTYTFIKSKNQNVFASAGLSSYLMLKEKYTLDIQSNTGYPYYPDPSYSYTNRNQHLLSVINLSIGLEKPLINQTSLVIAPYARLPITGIGQGKVDLKSIGLNLQIHYSLKKKDPGKLTSGNAAQ